MRAAPLGLKSMTAADMHPLLPLLLLQCEKSRSSTPSSTTTPRPTSTLRPTTTPNTTSSTPNSGTAGGTTRPQAQAQSPSRVQPAGQQCGGLGGACAELGGCVAGPLANVRCAPGLTCREQNKYFWEVGLSTRDMYAVCIDEQLI
jgi:hypothetical protein